MGLGIIVALYRNQKKQKIVSSINIIGLAIAISCLTFSLFYMKYEWSYDKWNPKVNSLFRLTRSYWSKDGALSMHLGHISAPFAPNLENNLAGIEKIGRIVQYETRLSIDIPGAQNYLEKKVFMIDPAILDLFNIDLINGNEETSLNEPFKILLSEEVATKLFKDQNPVGRKLLLRGKLPVQVTGVFKPLPDNSHWHADYLISISTLYDNSVYGRKGMENNWENDSFGTYFLANEALDVSNFENQLNSFIDKNLASIAPQGYTRASNWSRLHVQRVKDIHLHSNLDSEFETNGSISSLYLIGSVSCLILILAVFNYVNLSIARYTERLKEVGVKKILGASISQLILQFLVESVFIALLSFIISFLISIAVVDLIKNNIYPNVSVSNILQIDNLTIIAFVTIAIGILAGLYPAILVGLFNPINIIKGQMVSTRSKFIVRKVLTTIQIGISVMLIVLTIHISGQLNFLNDFQLGYNRERIIVVPYYDELNEHYDAFYNTLTGKSSVHSLARSSRVPTERLIDVMDASFEHGGSLVPSKAKIKFVCIDHHFFDTYKIKFTQGRNFSQEIASDLTEGFILNEEAVKAIGWRSASESIGKKIEYGYISGKVVGVWKIFTLNHFIKL